MRAVVALMLGAALWAAPALSEQKLMPDDVISDRGLKKFVSEDRLPVPGDPVLAAGRAIWAENCKFCHGGNKQTGAPKITATRFWAPRIEQGMDTLFAHAIDGWIGPRYTQMPARGGNPDLSDEEVRSAVLFMIWTSGGQAEAEEWLAAQ
ncbi:MAG: c-type cytochrome [Pseudomonadota bacterium]